MLLLLCILLFPRLLVLFPEKAAGHLNLWRCRTALHVDSDSNFSSSCYVCKNYTGKNVMSSRTILLQLQWRKKGACFSLHLLVSVETSENVSFLPKYLVLSCYCSHLKKDAQVWCSHVACMTERGHETFQPPVAIKYIQSEGNRFRSQQGWPRLSRMRYKINILDTIPVSLDTKYV